jgi:hypothetical protein
MRGPTEVRPECVAGFMLEKLGEAYVSNRLGKVSREHLANKALVLYFEGKNKDEELMRAMQQAYQHFGCEEQTTGLFEIIYVTAAKTAAQFASSFRHMPWLSLPFTHALRREQLRHLFEVGEEKDAVVLLHMDGSTISREGSLHVKLAYRCQSSLNDKKQENKNQMELTKRIAKEAKQTATLETRLQKGVVAKLARCTTQLCKQMRKREFDEFIGSEQAELPPELRELAAAETALEGARVGIKALDSALLEQICAASEPPSDQVKESVEAIGVILGLKPDFGPGRLHVRRCGVCALRDGVEPRGLHQSTQRRWERPHRARRTRSQPLGRHACRRRVLIMYG